jgi:signal peptidase I
MRSRHHNLLSALSRATRAAVPTQAECKEQTMLARHGLRERSARNWIRGVVLTLLLALVGFASIAVLSGRYQVRPVLSGSMRPGLPVGGVVITQRVPVTSLHVRDVVVLHRPDRPGELIVHRIVALSAGPSGPIVQTQGDANRTRDPWKVALRGTTAYRAVYSVPFVGYAAVWVHSAAGRRTFILVGILLVLGAAMSALLPRRRRPSPARRRARRQLGWVGPAALGQRFASLARPLAARINATLSHHDGHVRSVAIGPMHADVGDNRNYGRPE